MLRAHPAVASLLLTVICVFAPISRAGAANLPNPDIGTGGPVLVLTSGTSPFETYYPEILRNEGLNAFAVRTLASATSQLLAAYDVVVLAEAAPTPSQVTMLGDYVNAGGKLIAMRPEIGRAHV